MTKQQRLFTGFLTAGAAFILGILGLIVSTITRENMGVAVILTAILLVVINGFLTWTIGEKE